MSDKLNITKEQKECIYHDKGNIIVSASAGSGKTFVIIQRIINLVAEKGVGVEKILATTFTNLAANEMKEKLKQALIDKFNETGDLRYKSELSKVPSASISTIHSFLSDLLKRFFYVIDIDANFEILDEKKAKKFSLLAIDELFSELYEEGNEEFLMLLTLYASKRKDTKLKDIILKIYNFSLSENSLDDVKNKSLNLEHIARNNSDSSTEVDEFYDIEQYFKIINALINITKKFKEKYDLLKKEENYVDFNDLEFLTLKLFENEEILNGVKNSYKYIFVDEYQDVNSVQEKIISLLANDNLFMVGDSKQSIYGFRGCNPKYFINKVEKYSKKQGGIAVSLNDNFRSSKKVIDAVNNIFNRVMTTDGGFYDSDYSCNPMISSADYGTYEGDVVIHVVEKESKPKEQSKTLSGVYSVIENSNVKKAVEYDSEDLFVVKLINDLIYEKKYYDAKTKEYKPITYGDVCILLRSLVGVEEGLVKTLVEHNIPVSSGAKNSISGYPEVKAVYSVIQAIYSLENDVALASVMLNFKNFTESELSLIRKIGGKKVKLFESLQNVIKSTAHVELAKKVEDFILWFDKIRLVSEYQTAGEVLRRVIKESNFDIKLKLTQNGKSKLARVERFIGEATLGGKALTVLEFYDYLLDAFDDITVSESEGEGTVKIMTAHSSKGLEFPVVIAMGINKRFNYQEKGEEVLMDRTYGLAPKSYNLENMTVSEGPARTYLKSRFDENTAREEARLLYVQLTRAKCELHIIVNEELEEMPLLADFSHAKSQAKFLSCLDATVVKEPLTYTEENLIKETQDEVGKTHVLGKEQDVFVTKTLKENLSFKYPYKTDTTMPVKQSVSALNDNDEYYKVTNLFGESDSETGTAYHRFFELSSFDDDRVEEELASFANSGLITSEQLDLIDVNKLKSILKMSVFDEIKGKTLYKEQKFCYFVNAKDVGYDSEEKILIQGIIDLMVVLENEVWLLDYKLSKIESEEDFVKAYKKQMQFYKSAIETVLNKKVSKVLLVNILQEKVVKVDV